MDAQTRERGPSAEQPLPQRTKDAPTTAQGPAPDAPEKSAKTPSLRDRLREHWLIAALGTIVLIAVEHAAPSDLGYQQTIDAMTWYFGEKW